MLSKFINQSKVASRGQHNSRRKKTDKCISGYSSIQNNVKTTTLKLNNSQHQLKSYIQMNEMETYIQMNEMERISQ